MLFAKDIGLCFACYMKKKPNGRFQPLGFKISV